MTYGLKVNNANDISQIDSGYSNFEIVSTGYSAARSGVINFGGDGTYLMFCRPRTNGNQIGRGAISDTSRTFLYESGASASWGYTLPPPVNWQGLDYFIARPSYHLAANKTSFGLHVFDSAARTVFDSNRNYLKVVRVIRLSMGGGYVDYTFPAPSAGKKYYFCALPLYFHGADRSKYGDEDYYGHTSGFINDTTLRIYISQIVYYWEGTNDFSSNRYWGLPSTHSPFFLVAEF